MTKGVSWPEQMKDLEMGRLSSTVQMDPMLSQEYLQEEGMKGNVRERGDGQKKKGLEWCPLKIEESMSQGMQAASRNCKRQRNTFFS